MKLSTFLLLLDGKAWFPSITELRDGDPLEAALGDEFYERLWERLDREEGGPQAIEWISRHRDWPDGLPESDVGSIHARVYGRCAADDIAALRAAWCWFRSETESAAMWSVYGHQGVAVMTDLERLHDALPAGKDFKIGDMVYVDRFNSNETNIRKILQEQPDLLLRPYFLKAIEYQHEREVRVVAHCPAQTKILLPTGIQPKGLILDKGLMITGIKSEVLIREIRVSPLLPPSEAEAIERFVAERLRNSVAVTRSSLAAETTDFFSVASKETLYGASDNYIDSTLLPSTFRHL